VRPPARGRPTKGERVTEASWARSVYLYVMCAVSVALVLVGLSTTIVGLVHTVAPDLGHRDTLDRVGIGLSNIAGEVIGLVDESQLDDIEEFCEDVTDTDDDFDDCVDDEQSSAAGSLESIEQGIAEVKDELRTQIRNNSIDHMIRGLLLVAGGVVLFRIHGRRTELFGGGLMPKRQAPEPPPAATWTPSSPAPPAP
jgi:hypothetical protein